MNRRAFITGLFGTIAVPTAIVGGWHSKWKEIGQFILPHYEEPFQSYEICRWDIGNLNLDDWRYMVRIANINLEGEPS